MEKQTTKAKEVQGTEVVKKERKDSQSYALKQLADMAKKFKANDWITKEEFEQLKAIHVKLTQKFIGGNVFDE